MKTQKDLQDMLKSMNKVKTRMAGDAQNTQELVRYYLETVKGVQSGEGDEVDSQQAMVAFEDLFQKLQLLQSEYARLSGAKDTDVPKSLKQLVKIQTSVIRLQAWWRKVSTMKRLDRNIRTTKSTLTKQKNQAPESMALMEFTQQLKAKKLTPESFFRICDTEYTQRVAVQVFKQRLQDLGLQLSKAQISRLIMILDEDIEGTITMEEYTNALEAYGCSGERHRPMEGSVLTQSFQHRCLFKLLTELQKKDITFSEVYNVCDVNDDEQVNLSEVRNFIEGLSSEFKQKEVHALIAYMDIDGNGLVTREEFLRQMNKGENIVRQNMTINKQIADKRTIARRNQVTQPAQTFNMPTNPWMQQPPAKTIDVQDQDDSFIRFEEVDVGSGDQASGVPMKTNNFTQPTGQTARNLATTASTTGLNADAQRRKQIVERMEREGQTLQTFMDGLKRYVVNGVLSLGTLLKQVEASFPGLTTSDRNHLVKDCLRDRTKIDWVLFEETISKYAGSPLRPTVTQFFQTLASALIAQMKSSPMDSFKQFFRANQLTDADVISEIEFGQIFGKLVPQQQAVLGQAFKSLTVDADGFVLIKDLQDVLLSYVSLQGKPQQQTLGLPSDELRKLIPGVDAMSPRTRTQNVVEWYKKELNVKNMKPLSLFKLADSQNTGVASVANLETAARKIFPSHKLEVVQELMQAFKGGSNGIVRREEFELLFNTDPMTGNTIQSSPEKKPQPVQQVQLLSKAKEAEENALKWVKKLDNAFLKEGISPAVAFKHADVDHDGVITKKELGDAIKRLVPEDSLSLMDLLKVLTAFDTNRNGMVEESEFIATIQKARDTTVIVQGGQKPVAGNSTLPDDPSRRSKLPMKDSNIAIQNQTGNKVSPGESLTLLINDLEDKVSLKRVFAEVTINEDGKYQVIHLQRRFKTEVAVKPSDYLPLIKELDSQQTGQVEVKAVIKLLEKHSRVYARDFILELKYISNFLEYRLKNRSTRVFFESNSTLRADTQLLEIDVLTQLNRCFDVPITIGPSIYKGMKTKTLQELCTMIDEHRVVKGESYNADPNKASPESILTMLRAKLQAFPKSIQAELSNKFKAAEDPKTKSIPFEAFFKILDQEQVITGPETRAIYKHLMGNEAAVTHQKLVDQKLIPALDAPKPAEAPQKPEQDSQSGAPPSTATVDIPLLIQTLEKTIGIRLDVALEDILLTQDDVIVAFTLHNKLLSYNRTLDKRLLTTLTQAISKNNNGKFEIRELVNFLGQIPGRYSQEAVLNQIIAELADPIEATLKDCNFLPNERYSRSDYLGVIQIATSGVSVFHALCLFYDLTGGEEEIRGQILIAKLKQIAGNKRPQQQTKPASTASDPKEVEAQCKALVAAFSQVSADTNIGSAVKKFQQILNSSFKSDKEALQRFDPSGKNSCAVDVFGKILCSLSGDLTKEELLALSFIPMDTTAEDYSQLSLKMYFFQAYTRKDVPVAQVNKYKTQLKTVYDFLAQRYPPAAPSKQKPVAEEFKQPSKEQVSTGDPQLGSQMTRLDTFKQSRFNQLSSVVSQIKQHLSDATKRNALLKLFENAADQAIQSDVLMTQLEQWGVKMTDEEILALERELDASGKGRFILADVIAFCKTQGIDLQYTGMIRQGTVSELRQKYQGQGELLTCGELSYEVIPDVDYYKGCPTMLTSEEAALCVAEKIYKSLAEEEDFTDTDFGETKKGDVEGTKKSLYFGLQARKSQQEELEYPPGLPDPEVVEWLRPEEYLQEDEEPVFISDGAAANDVMQGLLGDCWFISALSVLATRDELISGRIDGLTEDNIKTFKANQQSAFNFSKGVYPGIFHLYRAKGIYVFRFFKDFRWIYVIIDDRIPCVDKQPVFSRCKDMRETWVSLIEKAYAKLHDCYEALISGCIDDALAEMTGFVAEKLDLHDKAGCFPNRALGNKDSFWEYMKLRVQERCLMGCSKSNKDASVRVESSVIIDEMDTGIKYSHAYGILKAFEIDDKQNPGEKIRLVRVRNPWGWGEWTGAWNDKSEEVEEYIDELTLQMKDDDEPFDPTAEDGTFLMSYDDFSSIYNNMYVCVDFPEQWNGIRYKGQWEPDCSGGIPEPTKDEKARVRWASNPQYCIQNNHPEDLDLFVSLAQPEGRGRKVQGSYIEYPYSEVIHPINFVVIHKPFDQAQENIKGAYRPPKIERFDEKQVKKVSKLIEYKEVSARVTCPRGFIYIVPSTRQPGQVGPFILSVYFNQPKARLHFSRLDKPLENNFSIIEEEAENPNNVPQWKVSLCNSRLKYIIGDDDIGEDNLQVSLTVPKTIKLGAANAKVGSAKPGASQKQALPGSSPVKATGFKLAMNNKIKKKTIHPVGSAATHQARGNFNTSSQAFPGMENRVETQESYEYPD